MSKINVLSFEIANLIAAGEVVERPSSVLKELIENSIDAGADKIIAEIKRGGVSLIRVTDNGSGIAKEDLPIALKRHATSKIKDREDLDSIMTLGFRGEALAAISSVSQLTIISRTAESEFATMLTAEGGSVVDISEVGASVGTTVVVENLFYNVPARRKFLKKDSTEAMNVAALVEKVALSRPDISIQLLIDGEEKFKTPGTGDLISAVRAVFGRDFASKLIEVKGEANGISVTGLIGRSDNVRKNRNLQNVFINGRYVKSLTAMAAIEKAYTSYIAPEAFPVCVLFIEMSPSTVDVNVHPAKLEVKFSDERVVFETVYYTIKSALEDHVYRPELELLSKTKEYNPRSAFVPVDEEKPKQISLTDNAEGEAAKKTFGRISYVGETDTSFTRHAGNSSSSVPRMDRGVYAEKPSIDRPVTFASPKPKLSDNATQIATPPKYAQMTPRDSVDLLRRYGEAQADKRNETTNSGAKVIEEGCNSVAPLNSKPIPTAGYKIVGEAFNCYVFVEVEDELLVIDKHAAHERIIFEELKAREREGGSLSQELLLPISVSLDGTEISVAEEYREDILATGFAYAINNKNADITAIPSAIDADTAEALFVKMLDEISEGRGKPEITDNIRREKALYQIACKAAIKGGRVYDKSVIEWLVGKVLALPDITVCPHGRPIAYKLSKRELDRNFDRIK